MRKTELEDFWQELAQCEGFGDVLPGKQWSVKGGKKRALAAGSGFNGLRYRYVIRESNTAAVELQIDAADSVANQRLVQLLEKQKLEIEAAFGSPLDWNEDADSARARLRYWLGAEPVPETPEARRVLQVAMIQSMRRLIKTLAPYVDVLQSI